MNLLFATSVLTLVLSLVVSAHPGSGIAVDTQGRVFFAAGPLIVMIETNGMARTLVHDSKNEKFYQLHHLQPAPDGGLLTASDLGNAIWHFTAEGALSRFYPPPNQDRSLSVGLGGDPFAVDREGSVYAVNSAPDRFTQLLKVTSQGRISVLAGGEWGFADGPGATARFGNLNRASLIVAPDGALLLTDDSVRVRRVAPDGTVSTLAGGSQKGHADGRGPEARFEGAGGLAVNARGDVFVAEYGGWIRQITPDGLVTTVAGSGGRNSVDGPVREASFQGPTGIAVAANGDLFVLEPEGPRVRKIAAGRVTTIHRGLP